MIIEKFKDPDAVYRRFTEKGRLFPEGLHYISSWTDLDLTMCFQLMETEQFELFEDWTASWNDIVDFRIIPVLTSDEAAVKKEI